MPYSQTTLDQFITQISSLMDDPSQKYWTVPEIRSVVYEGLRVWGAYTNYWRTRGQFPLASAQNSPYYDLSVVLPALRTRTWTLGQVVRDMQYMLLESPSGVAGTGMSGQVSVSSILNAIAVARNRFVLDVRFPLSIHPMQVSPPPPTGMITFPQNSVYVHKASWQDSTSGAWSNLWREDAWATDKSQPLWTIQPGNPEVFSEAENAPLQLQIVPPPISEGILEALTVDSLIVDLTADASTFSLPDEWIHAVKYSALSYLLSGEGQIKDIVLAAYAEKRYQQAVDMAKDARSMFRVMLNNVPLPIDTMAALDAGSPFWRNQTGPPETCGVIYDIVAVSPGIPRSADSLIVDVSQSAPLPDMGDPSPDNPNVFLQIGPEDMDHLSDYVTHVLTFKCGGHDFKSTISGYDNFMEAVANRKGVNAAKVRYLSPLFGQPQKEQEQRPDRIERARA